MASRPPDELPPEMPVNPPPDADTPDGPPIEPENEPIPMVDQVAHSSVRFPSVQ
jgi:hypothetical protein